MGKQAKDEPLALKLSKRERLVSLNERALEFSDQIVQASGKVNVNVLPSPGVLSTRMVPP